MSPIADISGISDLAPEQGHIIQELTFCATKIYKLGNDVGG
jgi:hypothetical protein